MTVLATIALTAYAIGVTALAYLFCFGDPGTLDGWLPFLFIARSVPLTAAIMFCTTIPGGGEI